MSKFSLVIPTMWRYAPFVDFLTHLVKLDLVGEIIIIDNDITKTPKDQILHHPKVKLHRFIKNIFVNPAWNYGVAVSSYDKICIMNDDIIFDLKVFSILEDLLKQGTMYTVCPEYDKSKTVTGDPIIRHFKNDIALFHFGALMFVHKEDWIEIPAGLDISHGDNWIWETMLCRHNQNYVVQNLFYHTPGSVTNSTITNDLDKEFRIFAATCRRTFRRNQGCLEHCKPNCPLKNVRY